MAQEVIGKGWQTFTLDQKVDISSQVRPSGDSFFDYPAFNGHPASSKDVWSPVDFVLAKIAKKLGVEDKKIRK